MLSQLEATEPEHNQTGFCDSDNNSSEYSDDDDESDDLEMNDTLDLMEPREDFDEDEDSCIID